MLYLPNAVAPQALFSFLSHLQQTSLMPSIVPCKTFVFEIVPAKTEPRRGSKDDVDSNGRLDSARSPSFRAGIPCSSSMKVARRDRPVVSISMPSWAKDVSAFKWDLRPLLLLAGKCTGQILEDRSSYPSLPAFTPVSRATPIHQTKCSQRGGKQGVFTSHFESSLATPGKDFKLEMRRSSAVDRVFL
jgi:hypothetical protein